MTEDSPFLDRLRFTTNGIRGVANVDLTPWTCARIGLAMGQFLGLGKKVLVGTDFRVSGPFIKNGLVSGLLSSGIHVDDAGPTPTPALQKFLKDTNEHDMGLIITASHNPPQFNGIKVIHGDGIELPPEMEREIEAIYDGLRPGSHLPSWNDAGSLHARKDVVDHYMSAILNQISIDKDKASKLDVIVDPGNGITGCYVHDFIEKLGVQGKFIFDDPDGRFSNRVSEPTPDSLKALSSKIQEEGASLGVGFDGDGDRAIFVDDEGTFHWGDESFSIILNEFLKEYKGWVVTPVSSSVLVQDIVEAHGAKLEWTRVGSITVSRRMLELEARIAGEENGGIFYGPHQPVRDGGMALALVVEIMTKTGESASDLFKALPRYHLHKETMMVPDRVKEGVLDWIKQEVMAERTITLDGVKVLRDDGSVLIRPSGTEPKYRSFADGKTREAAERLSKWGIELVEKAVAELDA